MTSLQSTSAVSVLCQRFALSIARDIKRLDSSTDFPE